ncbi:MAG: hypothetical protein Q9218_001920 [Villophora microphyllina]
MLRRIGPNISSPSFDVTRNATHSQQLKTKGLLRVPPTIPPGKRSSTPSAQNISGQPSWNDTATAGSPSRRAPKRMKPLTSKEKAEEVSNEVLKIDFSSGQPEAIQAAIKQCVLSALNPSRSRKRPAQAGSSEDDLSRCKRRLITCDQCDVTTARRCDMKYGSLLKHQKRHTRPYGCTFPGCYKKLGSKNDWKRHENTQHYQIETWRCQEVDEKSAIRQCASIFYRREQFQGHLREKHQIHDDEHIREQSKCCRIGRNGQNRFWCGFCKKIVKLETKGLVAWEERFSHIDNFHYKKGQSIYQWVQLDSDLPNIVMGRGDYMESLAKDDEEDDQGADDESSGYEEEDRRSQRSSRGHASAKAQQNATSSADAEKLSPAARHATTSRRSKIWTCVSAFHVDAGVSEALVTSA